VPTNWCCLRMLAKAMAFVCGCLIQVCAAQTYPSQPVRLVVPYPPGGTTDIVARQYAEYLTNAFKQAVVVENRPGGTTNIAAEAVVKSQPDGLTWLFSGVNQTINPSMGPVPSFDLLKVLAPVTPGACAIRFCGQLKRALQSTRSIGFNGKVIAG
jgi:tripartite-type tricarboxylate transporter receptor subunit TctC